MSSSLATTGEPLAAAVRELPNGGEALSADLHRRILVLGSTAVPALIETLNAFDTADADWAPVHAAQLLGELGSTEAIESMLWALAETEWSDALHDQIILSLPKIGAAIVEPALRAWRERPDQTFREGVASILAAVGVRDKRILAVLLDELREDPSMGAADLYDYGDPAALPYLSDALDAHEIVETDNPLANHAVIELQATIQDLGGVLSAEQQRKCHIVRAEGKRFRRTLDAALAARRASMPSVEPVHRAPERPARNAPCWCGSGVKYKKCHLRADEGCVP